MVYNRSDEPSGHNDVGGFGDIEITTGTAFRLTKTWRTGGGFELHTDTASDPALGDSIWRGKFFWSVAQDVTSTLSTTFTAEYSHSLAEEHNISPARYLELSLPSTFVLPRDWSVSASYKLKIDFENGDHCTHTVKGGIAKRLSSSPIVVSATIERPLDGGDKKFQANLTLTYYFERYGLPK